MSGEVIIAITLNATLHVRYRLAGAAAAAGAAVPGAVIPVARPEYRADGRGATVARLLSAFGHEVLAAGLAGGAAGELIAQDLARAGVPTAFTQIRAESRRILEFAQPGEAQPGEAQTGEAQPGESPSWRFAEPGPYITTEELGRFAADYRRLLGSAAVVVLCGSLPDGLPPEMYGSLVRYATEAGVPAILDAGGAELALAAHSRPALVVAGSTEAGAGKELLRLGAGAAAILHQNTLRVTTPEATWTATLNLPTGAALDRGALVAGLVPGELLGWSWPDRLRHALALAAGPDAELDPDAYERLLAAVTVTSAG